MNHRHAKWVSFLQEYILILKHKSGTQNRVGPHSRRVILLGTMSAEVVGFMAIKEMYKTDPYFSTIVDQCESPVHGPSFYFLLFIAGWISV